MSLEQPIVRAVIEAVNATYLAVVWRNQSGEVSVRGGHMALAPVGSPDVVGYMLRGGRAIGIEVKSPQGRTQKDRAAKQLAWQQSMRAAGCVCGVVRNVGEALDLVLKGSREGT